MVPVRQAHPHQRAIPVGVDGDLPRVALDDDPPGDVEAEAGAPADLLGREERLERAGRHLGGHPGAGIGDLDDDPPWASGSGAAETLRVPGPSIASMALSTRLVHTW